MSSKKATRRDGIAREIFSAKGNIIRIEKIIEIIKEIYVNGKIPEVFITMPGANESDLHWKITSMRHIIKIIIRNLINRNRRETYTENKKMNRKDFRKVMIQEIYLLCYPKCYPKERYKEGRIILFHELNKLIYQA